MSRRFRIVFVSSKEILASHYALHSWIMCMFVVLFVSGIPLKVVHGKTIM
jgi:hypothetical protein